MSTAREVSQEAHRLAAISHLRQVQDPIEHRAQRAVHQRGELNLWGRLPTQGMIALRALPDKTARVYTALCSLLQGPKRQILVAEIAFLALLKDRQTRTHLKKLQAAGLIDWQGSLAGPNYFWLMSDCAGQGECREIKKPPVQQKLPVQSGNLGLPNKDQKPPKEVNPPTPLDPPRQKGQGDLSQKEEKTNPRSELDQYLEQRKEHQRQKQTWQNTKQEIQDELLAQKTTEAQHRAVERAIEQKIIPRWWVELLEDLPISSATKHLLLDAVPRQRTPDVVQVGAVEFTTRLLRQRQGDLDAALCMLERNPLVFDVRPDKGHGEISIGDIHRQARPKSLDPDEVERLAQERLGWGSLPRFEGNPALDRYGEQVEQVIELARKIRPKNPMVQIEKFEKYPLEAIKRLAKFEREKRTSGETIRSYRAWWRPTLEGKILGE